MSPQTSLAFSNVAFGYDTVPVVRGVSFAARAGRILGILGPNGAGKSSLVRLAAGLRRPWSGMIRVVGRDVSTLARLDVARLVALAPQDGALPEGFTVEQSVLMGRTPWLGWLGAIGRRDREITRDAMAATRVLHLADRAVDTLSGGERQRVVIARALAQESPVMLLDEPTSHLDLAHQAAMMDLAIECARDRAICVVGVFHDVNLAARSCDDLLFLREGSIVAQGTPEEAFTVTNIEAVYGVSVQSVPGPGSGGPLIIVPDRAPRRAVHVAPNGEARR